MCRIGSSSTKTLPNLDAGQSTRTLTNKPSSFAIVPVGRGASQNMEVWCSLQNEFGRTPCRTGTARVVGGRVDSQAGPLCTPSTLMNGVKADKWQSGPRGPNTCTGTQREKLQRLFLVCVRPAPRKLQTAVAKSLTIKAHESSFPTQLTEVWLTFRQFQRDQQSRALRVCNTVSLSEHGSGTHVRKHHSVRAR